MNINDTDRCFLGVYALKALVNNGVIDLDDTEVRLVHGHVNEDGERFVASWVRHGDDIYQPTFENIGGKQVIQRYERESFESAPIIEGFREYKLEQVVEKVEAHGHFGPWEPNPSSDSTPLPANVIPLHNNTLH